MNWGRVFFVFFSMFGLTLNVVFLYENNVIILFLAASVNFVCVTLRIGVKSSLSAEILATLLVGVLHLVAGFIVLQVFESLHLAYAIVLGAVVANAVSLLLLVLESVKDNQEDI